MNSVLFFNNSTFEQDNLGLRRCIIAFIVIIIVITIIIITVSSDFNLFVRISRMLVVRSIIMLLHVTMLIKEGTG